MPQRGRKQLEWLVKRFKDVFTEVPGQAKGIYHWIRTCPGQVVREHWSRLPQALYIPVWWELEQMLAQVIIEEPQSPWRSPSVVVLKPDGAI